MDANEICHTYLLEDSPADSDAFASDGVIGPHQRIAIAIGDLIDSSEPGGKVIGLEGGWGAGKSTVVNLIRSRVENNGDCTVISFDAWAHEGDPLRRTYLETLIRHLQENQWVRKEHWDNTLDRISHRRRTTSTRTVPKPTTLGTLFALSVFGVPFGTTLVSAAFRDGIIITLEAMPSWKFMIGSLLSLGPFIVLFLNMIRVGIRRARGIAAQEERSEWSLLLSHAITQTKTETVESPDPTSIEFEDTFTSLMEEALQPHTERRLLLILDNLDRIDPSNAISIWSTLQTFLQDRYHQNDGWFKQLWVIVPYDPNGLRKLWDNRAEVGLATSAEDVNDARVASDSFLDKSFQIRFRVPPPVLSDWKSYLYDLIETSLPDHDMADRHLLYRVFDQCRIKKAMPPTPRELKLYVNQIGAIHRQWQHAFPIGHMAYYVLQCRNERPLIQLLQSAKLPTDEASRLLGDELQASLAGLAFNVPVEKGQELLLADPIYERLAEGANEELVALAKRHPDGFWPVLEIVVSTKLNDADATVVAKSGRCLDESQLLEDRSQPEIASIFRAFQHVAQTARKWEPFDETMGQGIAALCRLLNSTQFSRTMINAVTATLSAKASDSKGDATTPEQIVDGLLVLFRELRSLGHKDIISKPIPIPCDANGWITACHHLIQTDREESYWQHVRPKANFAEITTVIQEAVSSGEFSQLHVDAIRVTEACSLKAVWKELSEAIRQRLDASVAPSNAEITQLLRGANTLQNLGDSTAGSDLKELADGGHLMHHFYLASTEKELECQSICMFSHLRKKPNASVPVAVGNSAAGHQQLLATLASNDESIASHLVSVLREYDGLNFLFDIADAREEYDPMIGCCLREIASGKIPQELFTPSIVLGRWQAIESTLDVDDNSSIFRPMIGLLARDTGLCEAIQSSDSGFDAADVRLYWTIVEEGKEDVQPFYEWCKTGLESLDRGAWLADLKDDCDCVWLACDLYEHGTRPELTTPFEDALVDHARLLVAGKHVPSDEVQNRWPNLLECLTDQSLRHALRKRLLDIVASCDGKVHECFFEMYGKEISEAQLLLTNDQTISGLFSPLLRTRPMAGLLWLKKVFEEQKDILNTASDEHAVQEFQTRLRDCLSDEDEDEARDLIGEIAEILGIEAAIPYEDKKEGTN